MKQFLAIFLGSPTSEKKAQWDALDEKTRNQREKAGIEAWTAWGSKYKDAILDTGAPLGKTKLVDSQGISGVKNLMTAYTIVRAESHEEAAKIFAGHPHFTIFPGDSVEVMECLPLPKMG